MKDKTLAIGFFYVVLFTLLSICEVISYIVSLSLPKWTEAICIVGAFFLWLCGMAFLYRAEKIMRNPKSFEDE